MKRVHLALVDGHHLGQSLMNIEFIIVGDSDCMDDLVLKSCQLSARVALDEADMAHLERHISDLMALKEIFYICHHFSQLLLPQFRIR